MPVAGSQESVVHALLSLQLFCWPGTQAPFEHWSPTVQALLSLHGLLFAMKMQLPLLRLQESVVHALLSLHILGVLEQAPVAGSQLSVVHALLSLQLFCRPGMQAPAEHTSWT